MKKIVFAIILLAAVLLTACSATYNINELGIDRDKYPNWYADTRYEEDYEYLYVRYSGRDKNEPMEKMTYMVFESSAEARKYYKYWKDYCDDSSEIYDKGGNWFIARTPNTYDAEITEMYYRDQNVIICAEVYITTYSTLGDSHSKDSSDLESYVRNNQGCIYTPSYRLPLWNLPDSRLPSMP